MRKFIFFLMTLMSVYSSYGQITINNTLYNPTQLVNGVLIPTGSGVTVSNVTFSGVYNQLSSGVYRYQVGYFSTATTTLAQMGFSSGIVLSTGNTSDIPLTLGANPQAVAQMSIGYPSCTTGEVRETGTCPTIINDVNILAGTANYYNAAILEFDFVPVGDIARFRYIFGSEEFTDNSGLINYQCSSYNDQFGFLISGPGIAGGQGFTNNARNIARLANGSQVCINAVNNGTVGSSGGAPSASKCQTANPAWVQNTATAEYLGTIDGTGLNGNTVILTAEQTGLTPGQTYHIKLIVTDVNDAAYDAVVYLEAGSFTTVSCTNPAAPTMGAITQPTCTTPTGTVALSGLPATGTWTVTASPRGATITGIGTTANFSGLSPSVNYTFTATNAGGCTSVASLPANISAIPSNPTAPVIGTITQPSCVAPTGSVNLSGLPSSGSWTVTASPGGATLNGSGTTGTFIGLNPGNTYTFTVTNSSGCTSPASANAVINVYTPTPPVVGTITQTTCATATGSVALSGLPSSGTWEVVESVGSTSITGSGTTATFSGLAPGTYTFTVIDNIGCPSGPSTSATIQAQPATPSAPVVGTVTQPTCAVNTGSIALSGLPSTGTWTLTTTPGGSTTGTGTTTTVSGLVAGSSYSFTVTNASGCTSTSTAATAINTVPSTPGSPVIGTITQPSCSSPQGSVDLSGLPAGNWTVTATPGGLTQNGSGATATFTGLSPNTTYTFTVTNNTTLCTSVPSSNAVINLYSPSAPVVGTVTQPTCSVATGTVALSGLPAGTWTLTATPGGATFTNTGATFNFTGLTSGSYTFTVTDNVGCISPSSTVAVVDTQPVTPSQPTIGTVVQPSCTSSTGSVQLTGLPAGNWTITATPGGATNGTGSTYTFTGLAPNSTFTYTVTNDDGCTSVSSAQAVLNGIPSAPSAPVIGAITQPDCLVQEGSVELSGLPASGLWVVTATPGGTTLVSSGTTGTFTDLGANNTYTFTVTDENGCTSSSSLQAVINGLPTPPSAPAGSVTVQPTCTDPTGTIVVTTPTGANYQYSVDGTNYQSSGTFTGLQPGTYSVSVMDLLTSCTSTTTSLVVNAVPNGPAAPVVNITTQPTCADPTGTFEVVSPLGANYSYSCGGVAQTATSFTGLLPGQTYSVTVTDLNTGCVSGAFDVTFNSIPAPESVDAGPDQTISAGESVTLTATGNGTMVWNNGDVTSTTVSPTVQTTYTVTLTDANGCTSTDQATVFIAVECGDLFIPTAFSPNGDALNTSFRIKINPSCVKEMDLKVFDRWGELVFETTDPSGSWDGKFKGKELDPAVFVYTLDILLISDTEEQHFKGNLTLIK
jgi:gliding motility-associated-like protein